MTNYSFPLLEPPAPPDPTKAAIWAGQIRAIMPLAGGVLGTIGVVIPTLTDTQLTAYVYAAMVAGGLALYIWAALLSKWSKIHDRATLVASSVASARAGTPIAITVTPGTAPNIATLVSATEVAASPPLPAGPPQPAPVLP